jgi:hypothetical protein
LVTFEDNYTDFSCSKKNYLDFGFGVKKRNWLWGEHTLPLKVKYPVPLENALNETCKNA